LHMASRNQPWIAWQLTSQLLSMVLLHLDVHVC
jgi:hypothetical protein